MKENATNKTDISISSLQTEDSKLIYNLVKSSGVLDVNSEYLYLLLGKHFAKTCIIAKSGEELAGFVSAYILPEKQDTLFIWQVAVDEKYKKQGLASLMLNSLISKDDCKEIKYIHASISPSNHPSRTLFQSFANKIGAEINEAPFISASDFSKGHEDEPLIIIGPIKK